MIPRPRRVGQHLPLPGCWIETIEPGHEAADVAVLNAPHEIETARVKHQPGGTAAPPLGDLPHHRPNILARRVCVDVRDRRLVRIATGHGPERIDRVAECDRLEVMQRQGRCGTRGPGGGRGIEHAGASVAATAQQIALAAERDERCLIASRRQPGRLQRRPGRAAEDAQRRLGNQRSMCTAERARATFGVSAAAAEPQAQHERQRTAERTPPRTEPGGPPSIVRLCHAYLSLPDAARADLTPSKKASTRSLSSEGKVALPLDETQRLVPQALSLRTLTSATHPATTSIAARI